MILEIWELLENARKIKGTFQRTDTGIWQRFFAVQLAKYAGILSCL